jgi:ligand-binding sensor domain-containing protein
MLEGKHIDCIDNYKGTTWIASGKELFHFKGSEEKIYTLDFPILDISIAGDETLWIGTSGGGLGHLTNNGLTWFTKANSDLPRDYIRNVEVGLDGRIWFSSCAFNLGGLVMYNGKKFEVFTPQNSMLNQHVIDNIAIDHNGSLYVMTLSKVTKTNIYKITNDTWQCLGNENGTFYWATEFSAGPSGILYLMEDFMLSSSSANTNTLYGYWNNKWEKLEAYFMSSRFTFFTAMIADRRNYCWAASIKNDTYVLHVYNGKSWIQAPQNITLGDKITTIRTDNDNNIWIGTDHNGIFVISQQ